MSEKCLLRLHERKPLTFFRMCQNSRAFYFVRIQELAHARQVKACKKPLPTALNLSTLFQYATGLQRSNLRKYFGFSAVKVA